LGDSDVFWHIFMGSSWFLDQLWDLGCWRLWMTPWGPEVGSYLANPFTIDRKKHGKSRISIYLSHLWHAVHIRGIYFIFRTDLDVCPEPVSRTTRPFFSTDPQEVCEGVLPQIIVKRTMKQILRRTRGEGPHLQYRPSRRLELRMKHVENRKFEIYYVIMGER
jgi:hypothetical protein